MPIRVLVGKLGVDGDDSGVHVVASGLRDAGMEVIYTGLHRHVAEVVQTAVHEDVDVIGLGIRAGAHMTIFPQLLEGLREAQADDVLVIGFEVDTPPGDIVEFVQSLQE